MHNHVQALRSRPLHVTTELERPIAELVGQHVAERPGAVGVKDGLWRLTYAESEFDAGARIAAGLCAAGMKDDGALEFLGRIDRQVKVREVRAEPAEAEESLCSHPAVAGVELLARCLEERVAEALER